MRPRNSGMALSLHQGWFDIGMRRRGLQQRPLDVGFPSGGRMDPPGFRARFVDTAVADAWIRQRDDPLDATGGGEDLPAAGRATGFADQAETGRALWKY